MPNYFDLTGKIALVTGGGRGMGREIAKGFAEHGADLVIASRKLDVLEATAAEISEATGRRVMARQCHVGEWDQVTDLVESVYAEFGHIDVLVNNAGMSPLYPSLSEVSQALWQKVIDVNLTGPFRMSSLIGERMHTGDGGSIINVSSTSSIRPGKAEVPYAAAKSAINSLTTGLAQSLGPNVRVNCLMPGPFRTDISDAWDWDFINRAMSSTPMKRVGEANEIVGAALLLASDAGSYINGSIIRVDGGVSGVVTGG